MAQRRVHTFMAERGTLPVGLSKKEAARFPSAVRGVAPAVSPARRRSGGCKTRKVRRRLLFVRREVRRQGCGEEEEPPPLPYL